MGSRARLLQDGRFRTLEQLFARAGHPGTESLGADGIRDVATYLLTL